MGLGLLFLDSSSEKTKAPFVLFVLWAARHIGPEEAVLSKV